MRVKVRQLLCIVYRSNIMFSFLIAVTIIIFLVVLSTMFFIWLLEGSKFAFCSSNGYIKFKSFVSFYNINPDRWELYDDSIVFRNHTSRSFFGDEYCFRFIDYYRYKLWKHKKEKYDTQVKNNQKYQEMIDILKQDIANFEKRNQKETSEKLNEIWKER